MEEHRYFRALLPCSAEVAAWIEAWLLTEYPDDLESLEAIDVQTYATRAGLVFGCEDFGLIEPVAEAVQAAQRHFAGDPEACPPLWGFEYADTGYRGYDDFGGGAVLVTPVEIVYFDTNQWLREKGVIQ
jgi:hypothetical protein